MPDGGPGLLLLDTQVWIWAVEGVAAELAESAIDRIERASDAGGIRVAAISVWEVAMLAARG
jgi:PIN domain nuclease of toxin-antitoxin system